MFSDGDRDRIRSLVLDIARNDPRVVAGAIIGSFATGRADRWSDLDLAFAAAEDADPVAVLDDWAAQLAQSESAVELFDLASGSAIYRVFLLPGALQVDVSVRPEADFLPKGAGFELVFGSARELDPGTPSAVGDLFGWAVVFALHARACIARGRLWQGALAIDSVRQRLLAIECDRRGLPTSYGRGFDDLPADLCDRYQATMVARVEASALRRALAALASELNGVREELGLGGDHLEADLHELRDWAS